MKTAILSDVHGNLEALRAVREALRGEAPDRCWFLGDAVGYGPQPNECVEELRSFCQVFLLGNHDAAAIGRADLEEFNAYARQAVAYAASVLTPENRRYLGLLLHGERRGGAFLTHSSPLQPERWHYVFTPRDAEVNFRHFAGQVCFIGHSHQPLVFSGDGAGRAAQGELETLAMREGMRYIVNAGSVGQPRDGDPRAAFLIYDEDRGVVRLCRVPYDIPAVQARMREAGLPQHLAARLSQGR